jgi:hypothetical protein
VTGFAVVLRVPHVAAEQEAPFCVKTQLTDVLVGNVFDTVAVNCRLIPPGSKALIGETETATAGTVTTAEPETVVLVTEVAVRITLTLLAGGVVGAV